MKNTILSLILLLSFVVCKAQPSITNLNYPSTVNLFDLYEISFKLNTYSNPYDPDIISVYAIFTGPNNRCDTVIGFYYEGYSFQNKNGNEIAFRDKSLDGTGWRIRFTPDTIGNWSFCIHAIDQYGETIIPTSKSAPYSFNCLSVTAANGFISKANTMYLKREIVENNLREYRSFFPVGPNIAWYSSIHNGDTVGGVFDYIRYVNALNGNANYMRVWLNRYEFLNLYGPEYAQLINGNTSVYFDSLVNQKDASELDLIINYASQHNVAVQLCFFSFGDFNYRNTEEPWSRNVWENNPFNTILQLPEPCDFFTDAEAIRITKNLIRYIIARWGYATNIMNWELWNEVSNMFETCDDNTGQLQSDVLDWHVEMSAYIRRIDPFHHCISTSMGTRKNKNYTLYATLFNSMDFVQQHNYQNMQKAKSKEQVSKILFDSTIKARSDYPSMPFFMGEFGFGQNKEGITIYDKDPFGIDLHNSLWSSLFSTSMGPASFWWWNYLDIKGLFDYFRPIFVFCDHLPILSDSFEAYTTGIVSGNQLVFPNNLEVYYLKNQSEDTIFGWCQDTAFCYQSLRWLTDSVRMVSDSTGEAWHFVNNGVFDPNGYVYTLNPAKKPGPSSNSNIIRIPISNRPVGSQYSLKWYNSETGLQYNYSLANVTVQQDANGKYLSFTLPSSIRDFYNNIINNTFGDVVFAIYYVVQGGTIKNNKENKE